MRKEDSPVTEWYKNKTIFITGGSGLMGKVMIEKLLYSCPEIKNIYILIRSKRGKTPKQRIDDMWKLPMFERLRKAQPDAIKKIIPLTGDLYSENLGLSSTDIELLVKEVNIVFHMGATLKLEAKLDDAVKQNTAGTARVLDIAKQMEHIEVFMHFSTAFCSADIEVFEERVYPSKDSPRDVIEITKWLNSDALESATPSIIAPHPNTYTYSKRLAETLVADEKDHLPVCIVRPAIVIPAVNEPLPGWVDNLNGPIGLMVGAGKGVIRSMHCKGENIGQFIPVDYAINASICIAYFVGTQQTGLDDVPVYNLTSSSVFKLTYREVLDQGRHIIYDYPFEMQVWYPDGDIRSSKIVHNAYSLFFHWLPAILIDFLMIIIRQKPFMLRIQKKIYDGLELLHFFSVRQWFFKSENFTGLVNKLTETDRKKFPMLNLPILEEYLRNAILGTRQYCVKEDLSSLPRCRRKQKVLYVIHKTAVYGFYYYIFYLLSCWIPPVKILFDGMKSILSYIPVVGYYFVEK
ncbi:putative fatty acyl-CoA reductase CG5065 [Diorhabda sublineata]|uniref:putative fatty acyl-CoA reductase CG5065 n=1 Tax=Diorhabda sublineata TaxID=1163346 RepID=UPI0024E14B80|nr:putative fatty acyl-CoA reductase CG5065 [Diorhabda sublineata]